MNFMIAIATGILIGWGASVEDGTARREELIMNVVVGSLGAYLGGWIPTAIIHSPANPGSLSFGAIVAAVLGATTALVVVNRIRDA